MMFFKQCIGGIFLSMVINYAQACDICGCSISGMSSAFFPQVQTNMVGLRFNPTSFKHPGARPNMNGNSQVLKDRYYDADFFFRWFPSKRMQLWINVPYKVHVREESLRTTKIQGVGDVQINGFYTLFQNRDSSKIRYMILGGGGLGLPTGTYQQRDETLTKLPVGFQIGIGAWSAQLSSVIMVQKGKFGIQLQPELRTFSTNEQAFRKGTMFYNQSSFFANFQLKNVLLIPQSGYRFEYLNMDKEYTKNKLESGGVMHWFTIGLDVFSAKYSAGIQLQTPFEYSLNGNQPFPGVRIGISAGLMF